MSFKPELIAPAGNMECARAAAANGADAVYFGLPRFNARMRADNFTEEQLPGLVRFLHDHDVRAFCTLNTLIFTNELADAERELLLLDQAGVDVVIVQDLGIAWLARELGIRTHVHGSTQMTITSPEGVAFAKRLGIKRVVIARETSMREIGRFGNSEVQLETFVHGALCVAYSGQCLTSEALGQRSANRGECAQACRLPYQLIVNGVIKDLGDRRYLLSPQDLAAVEEIPELIRLGVSGFKIEGRLKTPEYVAATCQVYRKTIDAALATENPRKPQAEDLYKLEMTFSRGLYSGWMHGVNHQELVHARFGKKRGPLVGKIKRVSADHVEITRSAPLKAGDGIVFDQGGDTDHEQGGRVWEIRGDKIFFAHGHINFTRLNLGDLVWKTSDQLLEKELRKSFSGEIPPPKSELHFVVTGEAGKPLTVTCNEVSVSSQIPLQAAHNRPLTTETLREQLGRLGDTKFALSNLENRLQGSVILPLSELNRVRRELISSVAAAYDRRDSSSENGGRRQPRQSKLQSLLSSISSQRFTTPSLQNAAPSLVVLCRTMEQITAALDEGCSTIYVDFEDLRRFPQAVALVRNYLRNSLVPPLIHSSLPSIFLATPRIQKAGEQAFFKIIEDAKPDGVLIRNLGGLDYFRNTSLRKIGDFSLNVANPLTADLLMREGLERVTISYDLNAQQVLDLLNAAPPSWFELTIHQHMPMFHMEHCVFAAFLSKGTDHTNCGRPCDIHNLKMRDRVGQDHPVKADVGCRNTVYNARAQSGVDYFRDFMQAGAQAFRVELLEEDATQTQTVLRSYRELLEGATTGAELSRRLNVVRQLGVTSGTLTVLG